MRQDGPARPRRRRAWWWVGGGLTLIAAMGASLLGLGSAGLVGAMPRERLVGMYCTPYPQAGPSGRHELTLLADGTYTQSYHELGGRQIALAIVDREGRRSWEHKTWTVAHRGGRTILHLKNYISQAELVPGRVAYREADVEMAVCLRWGTRLQLAPAGEMRYTAGR